jgi:hypothetical protein
MEGKGFFLMVDDAVVRWRAFEVVLPGIGTTILSLLRVARSSTSGVFPSTPDVFPRARLPLKLPLHAVEGEKTVLSST